MNYFICSNFYQYVCCLQDIWKMIALCGWVPFLRLELTIHMKMLASKNSGIFVCSDLQDDILISLGSHWCPYALSYFYSFRMLFTSNTNSFVFISIPRFRICRNSYRKKLICMLPWQMLLCVLLHLYLILLARFLIRYCLYPVMILLFLCFVSWLELVVTCY